MMAIVLSNSSLFIDSYAQNIIGYSESTITVKEEQTYCTSNTLELTDVSIKDTKVNKVTDSKVGSQIVVEASVTSNCEISNYPILILFEVRDSEGMTRYLALQNTTMSQGDQTTSGFSWTAGEAGDYELRVFTHACLRCSGDFGIIRPLDFTVSE
jgi:hypothetical protein